MTHHEDPQHCATCAYRQLGGRITITSPAGTKTEPACLTCAAEALDYYAHQPAHAAWFTANGGPELCC
jgi:hypothetical protein